MAHYRRGVRNRRGIAGGLSNGIVAAAVGEGMLVQRRGCAVVVVAGRLQGTRGLLLLLLLEELGRLQERIHGGQHDRRCAPGAYAHSATWGAATHACVSAPLSSSAVSSSSSSLTSCCPGSISTHTRTHANRLHRRLSAVPVVVLDSLGRSHTHTRPNRTPQMVTTGRGRGCGEGPPDFRAASFRPIHQINLRYSLYLFVVPFSHTNRRSRKCVSVPNYHEPHAPGRKPAFASVLGPA